jgi:hypothetical protein
MNRPNTRPAEAGSKLSLLLLISCLAFSLALKTEEVVNVRLSPDNKALQHRSLYFSFV